MPERTVDVHLVVDPGCSAKMCFKQHEKLSKMCQSIRAGGLAMYPKEAKKQNIFLQIGFQMQVVSDTEDLKNTFEENMT